MFITKNTKQNKISFLCGFTNFWVVFTSFCVVFLLISTIFILYSRPINEREKKQNSFSEIECNKDRKEITVSDRTVGLSSVGLSRGC